MRAHTSGTRGRGAFPLYCAVVFEIESYGARERACASRHIMERRSNAARCRRHVGHAAAHADIQQERVHGALAVAHAVARAFDLDEARCRLRA